MEREKIKSSELVIIKKILAWQVAQALGSESEEELKKHAMLVAVDYEDDELFDIMVGEDFAHIQNGHPTDKWSEATSYIIDNLVDDEKEAVAQFFSFEAAKRKWEKRIEFDSIDFISRIKGASKWTRSVQHLFKRDGHLQAIYWIVEVDRYRKSQSAIVFLAEHDALTGLYNRHKLDKIKSELKLDEGPKEDIYFTFIDLDDFKKVNDTYGHDNGDLALIALSKRLEEVFYHKANDIIFRLGGDEFLIVSSHSDENRILEAVKEANKPIEVTLEDGSTITIRSSIGYAHDMKKADQALYLVKQNGKHNYKKG
ncbi:MAG: GGDEF domain-containing protein [Bacilli bacterium]|nr:GGDEF domain-containing protein [Bacilli bacterium]